MPQRWEYMTLDLNKRRTELDSLNELGRDGWEAVAMVSSWGVGWRWVHPIVLLKRPVRGDGTVGESDGRSDSRHDTGLTTSTA
ncbi:MAG TPA: hypothetical protein VH419_16210 [Nocardioidaceae bacterium]|jgi:hypothetical protein